MLLTFNFCFKLASAVLEAVENNTLSIEPVGLQPIRFVKASAVECGGPKKCALTGQSKPCKHRIKLGDSSSYYYISPVCRYRITSVCNFFTYIRYIQQGLVKQQDVDQMFWEVMQLRKEMSLAKLGYFKEELWCPECGAVRAPPWTAEGWQRFYGYSIFISTEKAKDFPPLHTTLRSAVIFFQTDWTVFASLNGTHSEDCRPASDGNSTLQIQTTK